MNPANVSVDEAVAFLDRFPDVEAVDLILYDGNGVGPVSYTHLTLPTTPYV